MIYFSCKRFEVFNRLLSKVCLYLNRRKNSFIFRLRVFFSGGFVPLSCVIDIESLELVKIGKSFRLGQFSRVSVEAGSTLIIGNNFSSGFFCTIYSIESVVIGNNVRFAHSVTVTDSDYILSELNFKSNYKQRRSYPIVIQDFCLILTGSIVLKSSLLPSFSILAPYCIYNIKNPTHSFVSGTPGNYYFRAL